MKPLIAGEVLGGRFELLGELGRGGMATVWLAMDRSRGEKVALKVLHPHLAADASARERLRRELRAAALVHHDALLTPWDLHELDGHAALSMPYHRGHTLGETIASVGPLPAETVRSLGLQLGAGLASAHRLGVLHRDISAGNVMLDDSGHAVLMDFGLARVQDQHSTRHSAALGTAGHTAPEVYEGVRGDARSDLYSLGTVLYLAATGRMPFAGANPAVVLKRQMAGSFTPVHELRPELPAELAATIEALLHAEASARPQSATELCDLLAARARPEPTPTVASAPSPAPTASDPRAPRALAVRPLMPEGRFVVEVRARQGRSGPQRRRRHQGPGPGARYAVQFFNALLSRADLPKLPNEWTQAAEGPAPPPVVLTRAVASAAGLPPDALLPGPVLDEPMYRLVTGVSEACADNLAALAESQGYKARSYEVNPRAAGWTRLLVYGPLLIPFIWLCFAALAVFGIHPMVMIPFAVLLTIALPVISAEVSRGDSSKLPLAFARDLSPHLAPGFGLSDTAAAAPTPEPQRQEAPPPLSRGQASLQSVLLRTARLTEALEKAHLPDAAAQDLRRHVAELEVQARALAAHVDELERTLRSAADERVDAELGRLEDRLRRLDALERAGERLPSGERNNLERGIAALRQEQADAEAQEAQLTAALAQLAELGAAATAARRRLEGSSVDPGVSAQAAADRLSRDLSTLERAKKELDEQQRKARMAAAGVRGGF